MKVFTKIKKWFIDQYQHRVRVFKWNARKRKIVKWFKEEISWQISIDFNSEYSKRMLADLFEKSNDLVEEVMSAKDLHKMRDRIIAQYDHKEKPGEMMQLSVCAHPVDPKKQNEEDLVYTCSRCF
jgi:hypothetical protein